jgi:hypothetical protein
MAKYEIITITNNDQIEFLRTELNKAKKGNQDIKSVWLWFESTVSDLDHGLVSADDHPNWIQLNMSTSVESERLENN